MTDRPTWDEYFLEMARVIARRATCLRRRVGALLVQEKRILATGYNGAPAGLPHCQEIGCQRETLGVPSGQRVELCRGLHAEQNAIIQAALHGVTTRGAVLYCTTQPCITCAKMLINAGIVRVVYAGEYADLMALQMLREAGVQVEQAPAGAEEGAAEVGRGS